MCMNAMPLSEKYVPFHPCLKAHVKQQPNNKKSKLNPQTIN